MFKKLFVSVLNIIIVQARLVYIDRVVQRERIFFNSTAILVFEDIYREILS